MNLICGINPVLEALGSGTRHFDRLLVVKGLRNRRISEAISRAGELGIPLRFEARDTLDRMAGGVPHQGLIAVVSAKPVASLESLLEHLRDPPLLVVLDGVEDPRNLGAILRTAEAAGADGVLLPDRHSAGLSETVNRASAGALEHVRVATIGNVVQALEALKARGFWVVGFDATGTERWDAVDYRRPIALVLGGEGRGIRRLVREHCDHLVSIPLFGHVNSLNVSVAAGVALYEAIRQRGAVPSHVRPIPARPAAAPRIVGPSAEDGEHDPGGRARVATDDAPDEHDGLEERAQPMGLGEDEDRPAWSGPTVLKPVMGPRRDLGAGRGRHAHGRRGRPGGRRGDHERGRGHDRPRERPRDHERAPEHGRGAESGVSGAPPAAGGPPQRPQGPRRHRGRRGGRPPGAPPAGGAGAEGPREGPGPGQTSAIPGPADGPPAAGNGGANGGPDGAAHRRRRRRRRR